MQVGRVQRLIQKIWEKVRTACPVPTRPGYAALVVTFLILHCATGSADESESHQWWSYRPVQKPQVPDVEKASWAGHPVDRFILAKLEGSGLAPSPPADRRTLIRRLSFILTGLPPGPKDTKGLLSDDSPDAYERLVDRLLASPHFGEHWARHWMDVVGYTDTYAYEVNFDNRGAWRYCDYLVRAFNDDVPYDQLIREQIAGDLLPKPRWNESEDLNESMIGPVFLQMGEFRYGNNLFMDGLTYEFLDHQIDSLTKAFQSTTVACARCHDHKIDPVSMRDYYALAGVLMSSRWTTRTIDGNRVNSDIENGLREMKPAIRAELIRLWKDDLSQLSSYLMAATKREAGEYLGQIQDPLHDPDPSRLDAWRAVVRTAVGTSIDTSSKDLKAKLPMDHPLFPWRELVRSGPTAVLGEKWMRLAARFENESNARIQFNREHFTT